jgi:hypothetical protein
MNEIFGKIRKGLTYFLDVFFSTCLICFFFLKLWNPIQEIGDNDAFVFFGEFTPSHSSNAACFFFNVIFDEFADAELLFLSDLRPHAVLFRPR